MSQFSTSRPLRNFCSCSNPTYTRKELITPKTRFRNATWYDPTAAKSRSLVTRKIIRLRPYWLDSEEQLILKPLAFLILGLALFQSGFNPDGAFWIIGKPPADFSDFSSINLNGRRLRRLPTQGLQVNNGRTFHYKTLTVKRDNFSFTTETRGGV